MDPWQARAIASHESRHRGRIRQAAERLQEYIGYVLRDLDNPDRRTIASHYASDVLSDAQTIVTRFAMLEAMGDVLGILASGEPGEG